MSRKTDPVKKARKAAVRAANAEAEARGIEWKPAALDEWDHPARRPYNCAHAAEEVPPGSARGDAPATDATDQQALAVSPVRGARPRHRS
jgi:hypothetical protein